MRIAFINVFLLLFVSVSASGDIRKRFEEYQEKSRREREERRAKYGEVSIPAEWNTVEVFSTMNTYELDGVHFIFSPKKPLKALIYGKEGCLTRYCEVDFSKQAISDYMMRYGFKSSEHSFDDSMDDNIGFSWISAGVGLGALTLMGCCISAYYGFHGCCFIDIGSGVISPDGHWPDTFDMIIDEQERRERVESIRNTNR